MVGDESVRRSAVDGRSRMSPVGQAPPCRKPDRRDQARFEALNRAGSGWEIVRETLKRPWSTGSDSLSRSRPTSPSWSAARSATCGRHSTRLPISWPRSTLVPHRGCRANDGVTDPHLRRAVRRLGDFEEQTHEAAPLGDLREAGFRTIRSGQPFAERLRRSADDRGGRRWQIAGG